MLKRTLIVIAVALGIGCKDKRMEQKPLIWHEVDTTTYYNADSSFSMSIHNHWCVYDSCPHIVNNFRGEGYSEDTIHVCVYDRCPHLRESWVVVSPKSSGAVGIAGSAKSGHAIKDTVPKPTGKVLTCGENPLIMGGSGYVLGTGSLGNIIEDKGIPTWKEVSGGGRVRAWPDTNHIYYNPSKDSLP